MFKVFRQVKNAVIYSLDGFVFLMQNEFAARLEFYGAAWVYLLFIYLGVSIQDLMITLVLFCLLISVEAINTAIEVVIDRISPEISHTGKHAKDLGSFAVLCVMVANFIFIAYVLSEADFGTAIIRIRSNPTLFIGIISLIMLSIYSFAWLAKKGAKRRKASESNQ